LKTTYCARIPVIINTEELISGTIK